MRSCWCKNLSFVLKSDFKTPKLQTFLRLLYKSFCNILLGSRMQYPARKLFIVTTFFFNSIKTSIIIKCASIKFK